MAIGKIITSKTKENGMYSIIGTATPQTNDLEIWIPSIVSIITLLLNGCFYIFVQPRLNYKAKAKESLKRTSAHLLNYLAEIISYDDFDGVPTKVRQYSLQIHLHFKNGTAYGKLELLLEQIYKAVRNRKSLTADQDIDKWNEEFRIMVRDLRKELAKNCGAF